MTVPRFILGKRGSEFGVFVSAEGVDASTAPASELMLHITSATAQIVLQGVSAPPFPKTVFHTLGYAPFIICNVLSTDLLSGAFGYVRPFDNSWAPWVMSQIESQSDRFIINQQTPLIPGPVSAAPISVNYFIFNKAAP